MDASIRGEVVEVEVESAYNGSVYERTVRLDTGQSVLDCFEGKDYVTEEDCGEFVDVVLLAQRSTGKLLSETTERGIFQPNAATDSNRSKWRGTLRGEVVCVDSDELGSKADASTFLLDVGSGTILVSAQEGLKDSVMEGEITCGSIVQVESGRIDIISRN